MWPLKSSSFVQPVPSSGEGIPLPSLHTLDGAGNNTSVFQERPPLKQIVKQLLLLPRSQWRKETAAPSPSTTEGYAAVLHSGAGVWITRHGSSSLAPGEQLKTVYQLFINQDLVGTYFEYDYVGGGHIIGGEFAICELYTHIAQGVSDDQNNSREWRAAKEEQLPRHSKLSRG